MSEDPVVVALLERLAIAESARAGAIERLTA
jgi:hypothetical protein